MDQNRWLTPLEKCQFFDFLNLLFLEPGKAFFRSRISEKAFSWSILPKKKVGKMASFGPKAWVNPFGKISICRLFELVVFIAQKGVLLVYNIVGDIFSGLYWLKKKVGEMAIFGPKPSVNPFGKMSICRLFELVVFIAWKGVFSLQNIVKDIFLGYIT